MRKKFTLLIYYLSCLVISHTVWSQQGKGALLPQYQEAHIHNETCSACCNGNIGDYKVRHLSGGPITSINKISPRRGEESNPNFPNFNNVDTIHGAKDVNVVFGAGESSIIRAGAVNWPATGGTLIRQGSSNPSILLGSK